MTVLDLGQHPPSDGFLSDEQLAQPERRFPLTVVRCEVCRLVQLSEAVDPALLFGDDFVYQSGLNKPLALHLQAIPQALSRHLALSKDQLAVDLGSNDGTLLKGYRSFGTRVLGVDPSGVARLAIEDGVPTLQAFFDERVAEQIAAAHGRAHAITATNVFAHVKALHSFMAGVTRLLDERGIFLTESHYWSDLVEHLQYDEIYLEHLRYYTVEALITLFDRFGMDVFHAERVPTHGGSIRVLACRRGAYPRDPSVDALCAEETGRQLTAPGSLARFRRRVEAHREQLRALLARCRADGSRIAGIGAPAKGNTLLNYCGIGPETLEYLAETNTLKIGKRAPGSRIPIVAERRLFEDQPAYALLLVWNLKETLITALRAQGYRGRFIMPAPIPEVIA